MKIHEIFLSVSGECGEFRQGQWVVFVRLAGCNLRCRWCDTVRAQLTEASKEMTSEEVLAEVRRISRVRRVIITGGEPLVQLESVVELCHLLNAYGYAIQIETNGSIFPPDLPVTWVMDYKLPSSGMTDKMLPVRSFQTLPAGSWIKFVIADDSDYEKAVQVAKKFADNPKLNLAFSACPPSIKHAELFHRMKADGLENVLLNVQIHKLTALKES
jgi:7-carboxy-7-deazaguanine synthase